MNIDYRMLIMQVNSIEIVEFILARRKYIQLSVLGSEMLNWFLGDNDYIKPIKAICGLVNSIFLCRAVYGVRFVKQDVA